MIQTYSFQCVWPAEVLIPALLDAAEAQRKKLFEVTPIGRQQNSARLFCCYEVTQ